MSLIENLTITLFVFNTKWDKDLGIPRGQFTTTTNKSLCFHFELEKQSQTLKIPMTNIQSGAEMIDLCTWIDSKIWTDYMCRSVFNVSLRQGTAASTKTQDKDMFLWNLNTFWHQMEGWLASLHSVTSVTVVGVSRILWIFRTRYRFTLQLQLRY